MRRREAPREPLSAIERRSLEAEALATRERILAIVYKSGSGHLGAALSQTDLLVAIYHRYLRFDSAEPLWPERDRFVLSKGHGGLGLAPVLARCGFVPEEALASFGKTGAPLGMHMDHRNVPGVETSTGSLGHGLGIAVGMALGAKQQGWPSRTYCLLSDGECYEGSTWEAALAAPAFGLGRLIAIVDRNRLTMDGFTEDEVPLEPLVEKWRSFGWRAVACNGHDLGAICRELDGFIAHQDDRPTALIAETVKGKGVDFMAGQAKWHYGALDSESYERARASLRAGVA